MASKRTNEILEILDAQYSVDLECALEHETAWQLLIATILSAQCTDARVNIVTKDLFKKYPSIESFAKAELLELEQDIHSTGFYHNKAKNIIACCKKLHYEYGDEVPRTIEELTGLPGVECNPGQYLPRPEHRRRYPCQADFKAPGAYKGGGSCEGRV